MNPEIRSINTEITEDNTDYGICTYCSADLDVDTQVVDESGDVYCEACYDDTYFQCYECGSETEHGEGRTTPSDDCVCGNCYIDMCSTCDHCDEAHYRDNMMTSNVSGDYLCDDCVDAEEYESNQSPDWSVLSNNYVKENTDFVTPDKDYYTNDSFSLIKSKRYQGIEIETNYSDEIGRSEIYDTLEWSIAKSRNSSDGIPKLSVVHDGSVTDGDNPYGNEVVVSPRRGDILYKDMQTISKTLKEQSAYISRRCGYHLHIDSRDYDWQHCLVLVLMTKLIEPHIYSWLPSSRRTSDWCRPVSQSISDLRWITDRDSFIEYYYDSDNFSSDKYNDKRYHGLNLHSHFQANQGIEFRYHSGTLNPEKMLHWSILWSQVMDKSYDLGNKLADEMRDNNITDLFHTSLFKSLKVMNLLPVEVDKIKSLTDKYRISEVEGISTNIDDYYEDSEYLRNILGLPKLVDDDLNTKVRAIQPMLRFINNESYARPVLTIDSLLSTFEIPIITQEFYKSRMIEVLDNPSTPSDHVQRCFNNVDMFLEFNTDTMKFNTAKVMGGLFPTIDSRSISESTAYGLQYAKGDIHQRELESWTLV
tara:strand:- start:157 stop:1923 length:1767 start_codon:yes stop_codon:yes gene_type:complete